MAVVTKSYPSLTSITVCFKSSHIWLISSIVLWDVVTYPYLRVTIRVKLIFVKENHVRSLLSIITSLDSFNQHVFSGMALESGWYMPCSHLNARGLDHSEISWWCNQMETFAALLALCDRWIPAQRPVTGSFDVIFDLRLNKRLSKQSLDWWFETRRAHYDVIVMFHVEINLCWHGFSNLNSNCLAAQSLANPMRR